MVDLEFYITHEFRWYSIPVLLLPLEKRTRERLHTNRYETVGDLVTDSDWVLDPKKSLLTKDRVQEVRDFLVSIDLLYKSGKPTPHGRYLRYMTPLAQAA